MYAVVDIQGQQFKVEEKVKYNVPKLDSEVDKSITFDNVLIYSDDKTTSIGTDEATEAFTVKLQLCDASPQSLLETFETSKQYTFHE